MPVSLSVTYRKPAVAGRHHRPPSGEIWCLARQRRGGTRRSLSASDTKLRQPERFSVPAETTGKARLSVDRGEFFVLHASRTAPHEIRKVCDSPAVGAAAAISLSSTCQDRPVVGVEVDDLVRVLVEELVPRRSW